MGKPKALFSVGQNKIGYNDDVDSIKTPSFAGETRS